MLTILPPLIPLLYKFYNISAQNVILPVVVPVILPETEAGYCKLSRKKDWLHMFRNYIRITRNPCRIASIH